jgi:hypothetical protein
VNNASYGLAGGTALKATSRTEAYMIDSLAQGPGWLMGKQQFWAVAKGAPYLLSWNPNIVSAPKPYWYDHVSFDADVPIYGPHAAFPIFELSATGIREFLNQDHSAFWEAQSGPMPQPVYTDSFIQNVCNNWWKDLEIVSRTFGTRLVRDIDHGINGAGKLVYATATDPGRVASDLLMQAYRASISPVTSAISTAATVMDIAQDPYGALQQAKQDFQKVKTAVVEFGKTLETPEGIGNALYSTEKFLAPLALGPGGRAEASIAELESESVAMTGPSRAVASLEADAAASSGTVEELLTKHPKLNPITGIIPNPEQMEFAFARDVEKVAAKSAVAEAATIPTIEKGGEFVADASVFIDRPGAPGARGILDQVLNDSRFKISVPDVIRAEVHPTPSQLARLNNSAASIVDVASADVSQINPDILSKKFGPVDLKLLATAKKLGQPVVTGNKALINQVMGHPERYKLFGDLDIFVPGEHFNTADELLDLLNQ